eukprot:3936664-Rhodomonas_salina.2
MSHSVTAYQSMSTTVRAAEREQALFDNSDVKAPNAPLPDAGTRACRALSGKRRSPAGSHRRRHETHAAGGSVTEGPSEDGTIQGVLQNRVGYLRVLDGDVYCMRKTRDAQEREQDGSHGLHTTRCTTFINTHRPCSTTSSTQTPAISRTGRDTVRAGLGKFPPPSTGCTRHGYTSGCRTTVPGG